MAGVCLRSTCHMYDEMPPRILETSNYVLFLVTVPKFGCTMALQCTLNLPYTFPSPMKHNLVVANSPGCGTPLFDRRSRVLNCIRFRTDDVRRSRGSRLRLNAAVRSTDSEEEEEEDEDKQNDPSLMDEEERLEWRRAIKEALRKIPDVPEEMDPAERSKKVQQLLAKYPLVVEEDDPDWPEDSDGWGFNFSQFFDKITIKNNPKKDDEDNDDDSDDEIVWKDDNYIRPIKDVKTAEWEETVFKDISPLIILVHHRYRRFSLLVARVCF